MSIPGQTIVSYYLVSIRGTCIVFQVNCIMTFFFEAVVDLRGNLLFWLLKNVLFDMSQYTKYVVIRSAD